eukprot:TRINITY_DN3761_c0_g1_i2.p1 TRINITY_DN3761_c0_g1~~TRINITY_DN3761_c0_g1_i2.p1  ORF type:complete len:228 (-),score=53.01 TRINITY_DN3761_c0_g1_i2:608-1291(-)
MDSLNRFSSPVRKGNAPAKFEAEIRVNGSMGSEMEQLLHQIKVFFELCAGQLSSEEFDKLMEASIRMLVSLRSQKATITERCASPYKARFEALRYAYKAGARIDSKAEVPGTTANYETPQQPPPPKNYERQSSKQKFLSAQEKKEVSKKPSAGSTIKDTIVHPERQGRELTRQGSSHAEKMNAISPRMTSPDIRKAGPSSQAPSSTTLKRDSLNFDAQSIKTAAKKV